MCFFCGDKELFCVGMYLIVIGKEEKSIVLWRYEVEMSKWFKGFGMIMLRILFVLVICGIVVFVVGGLDVFLGVVNKVEKYDFEIKMWRCFNVMYKWRKFCFGCYL